MYGGTSSGKGIMVRGRMEERKKNSKGDQSHATITNVIIVKEKGIGKETTQSSRKIKQVL